MFTIAGILADEEPRTPISPSGLYDSSNVGFPNSDFSSPILSGRSEFTFMFWIYRYANTQTTNIYSENGSESSIDLLNPSGNLKAVLRSSASTNIVVETTSAIPLNQWTHVALTGSLINTRIRVYINGSLNNSSTMSYSLKSTTSADIYNFGDDYDIAQINAYDRELPESEVAEHYVYDEDTSQSGVLAFDAMTIAQRSGLIYCSSFIEDISFSGNEFKDRSGNNITLSPLPSLTGQQIYVYTDASDLPSDEPIPLIEWQFEEGSGTTVNDSQGNHNGTISGVTYSTDSAVGTYSLSFSSGNSVTSDDVDFSNALSISFWAKSSQTGTGYQRVIGRSNEGGATATASYHIQRANSGNLAMGVTDGTNYQELSLGTDISDGTWHHCVFVFDGDNTSMYAYLDGTFVNSNTSVSVSSIRNSNQPLKLGTIYNGSYIGQLDAVRLYDSVLTQDDVDALYAEGSV